MFKFNKSLCWGIPFLALCLATNGASAAPISLVDLQDQTVAGQDFTFNFNGLQSSDGGGGTLVLRAQGDYEGGGLAIDEFLDWTAEGVVGATGVGNFDGTVGSGGPFDFATVFQPLGNILWQRTYTLSGLELDQLLADSMISVNVDLADGVGLFDPPNFVEVTINYESGTAVIPLPASLPFLMAGLGALGLISRRKARTG